MSNEEDDAIGILAKDEAGKQKKPIQSKKPKSTSRSSNSLNPKMDIWHRNEMEKHQKMMAANVKRASQVKTKESNDKQREEQEQQEKLEKYRQEKRESYEKHLRSNIRQNDNNYRKQSSHNSHSNNFSSLPPRADTQPLYSNPTAGTLPPQHPQKNNRNNAESPNHASTQPTRTKRQWVPKPVPLENADTYLLQQKIEQELYENQMRQYTLAKQHQLLKQQKNQSHQFNEDDEYLPPADSSDIFTLNGSQQFNQDSDIEEEEEEGEDDDNYVSNQKKKQSASKQPSTKQKRQVDNINTKESAAPFTGSYDYNLFTSPVQVKISNTNNDDQVKKNNNNKTTASIAKPSQFAENQHQRGIMDARGATQSSDRQSLTSRSSVKDMTNTHKIIELDQGFKPIQFSLDPKFASNHQPDDYYQEGEDYGYSSLSQSMKNGAIEKRMKEESIQVSKEEVSSVKKKQQARNNETKSEDIQSHIKEFKHQFNELKKQVNQEKKVKQAVTKEKQSNNIKEKNDVNSVRVTAKPQSSQQQQDTLSSVVEKQGKKQNDDGISLNNDEAKSTTTKIDSNNNIKKGFATSSTNKLETSGMNSSSTNEIEVSRYSTNMKERRKFWDVKTTKEDFLQQPISEKAKYTAVSKFKSKLQSNIHFDKNINNLSTNSSQMKSISGGADDAEENQVNGAKAVTAAIAAAEWSKLNDKELQLQQEILSMHLDTLDRVKSVEEKHNISQSFDSSPNLMNSKSRVLTAASNLSGKSSQSKLSRSHQNSKKNLLPLVRSSSINPISELDCEEDLEASLMNLENKLQNKKNLIGSMTQEIIDQSKPKNPELHRDLLKNPQYLLQNPFKVDITNQNREYLEEENQKMINLSMSQKLLNQSTQQQQSRPITNQSQVSRILPSIYSTQNQNSSAGQQQSQSDSRFPTINKASISSDTSLLSQGQKNLTPSLLNFKKSQQMPQQQQQQLSQQRYHTQGDTQSHSSSSQFARLEEKSDNKLERNSISDWEKSKNTELTPTSTKSKQQQQKQPQLPASMKLIESDQNSSTNNKQQQQQLSKKIPHSTQSSSSNAINIQLLEEDKDELKNWWKNVKNNIIQGEIPQQSPRLNLQQQQLSHPQLPQSSNNNNIKANNQVEKQQQLKVHLAANEGEYNNGIEKQHAQDKGSRKNRQWSDLPKQQQQSENSKEDIEPNENIAPEISETPSRIGSKSQSSSQSLQSIQRKSAKKNNKIMQNRESNEVDDNDASSQVSVKQKKALVADVLDKKIIAKVEFSQEQIEQTIEASLNRIEMEERLNAKKLREEQQLRQNQEKLRLKEQRAYEMERNLSEISGIDNAVDFSQMSITQSQLGSAAAANSQHGNYALRQSVKRQYEATGKVPSKYEHNNKQSPQRAGDTSRNQSFNNSLELSQISSPNEIPTRTTNIKSNKKHTASKHNLDEDDVIDEEEYQGDIIVRGNVNLQKLLFVD